MDIKLPSSQPMGWKEGPAKVRTAGVWAHHKTSPGKTKPMTPFLGPSSPGRVTLWRQTSQEPWGACYWIGHERGPSKVWEVTNVQRVHFRDCSVGVSDCPNPSNRSFRSTWLTPLHPLRGREEREGGEMWRNAAEGERCMGTCSRPASNQRSIKNPFWDNQEKWTRNRAREVGNIIAAASAG